LKKKNYQHLNSYRADLSYRLKFHNIIADEINLKISLKSTQEIDDAVDNLTTLIQSVAFKSNTINTTMNSAHKHPFVSEQVRSLIVEKRRARVVTKLRGYPHIKVHIIN
jgi:hypothetical protein